METPEKKKTRPLEAAARLSQKDSNAPDSRTLMEMSHLAMGVRVWGSGCGYWGMRVKVWEVAAAAVPMAVQRMQVRVAAVQALALPVRLPARAVL
jgi:hypothetical protein